MTPPETLLTALEPLGAIGIRALHANRRRAQSQKLCLPRQRGNSRDEIMTSFIRRQAKFVGIDHEIVNGALTIRIFWEGQEVYARLASLRPTRRGALVTNAKRWLLPTQMRLDDVDGGYEWGSEERPYVLGHTLDTIYFGIPDVVTADGRGVGFLDKAHILGVPLPPQEEKSAKPGDRLYRKAKTSDDKAG